MKYYTNENNELLADPIVTEGLTEVTSPIREDGTILPLHENLYTLETKDDGTYYEFYNEDGTPDLDKIQEAEDLRVAQEAKKAKIELLKTITVTTSNGNTFDGDDIARADMLSAIQASETLGQDTAMWKLSDNTWAEVSLDELREASALAIQAKGAILSQ